MELFFSHRNLRWVLVAQGSSRLADSLESLVFAWLVYQLSGSTLLMGATFAVNALPNIVLAPLSGVLADRCRKLPLMRVTAAGRALLAMLMVALLLAGSMEVWMLFVITVASSSFETLGSPAQSALARHLVEPEHLPESAGLMSTVTAIAQMVGVALAALLIGPMGMAFALGVDALLFVLAFFALTRPRITTDQGNASSPESGNKGEFTAGFHLIARDRVIRVVVGLAVLVNLFFTPLTVLETPLVKDIFHGGPELLAAIGFCLLFGMLSSGLLVGRVVSRWGTWNTLTAGLVGLGLSIGLLGALGAGDPTWLRTSAVLGLYGLAGVAVTLANASLSAWAQVRIPAEVQGRVFSVVGALGMAATPLGSAASGALAQQVPIPFLFVCSGVLVLVVSAVGRGLLGRWDKPPAGAPEPALIR